MPTLSLIAAIDENNGIGQDNHLLCHMPADLAYFKKCTIGKPIIMGRKTFESIGKPLPGRTNIVLSSKLKAIDGVTIVRSLHDALKLTQNDKEVMVIGGCKLFAESLPRASQLYMTLIHHTFEADVFFPPFIKSAWKETSRVFRGHDEDNPYDMTFFCYQKR